MNAEKCGITSATNYMESENNDVCPICKNTGFELFYNDKGQSYARNCKCGIRQRQILNNRLKFANLPESFKDVRLSNFEKTIYKSPESRNKIDLAVKCINYYLCHFEILKEQGMGLYMYSGVKGSGKTRMAISIANELMIEKKIQVKFCTSLQILNEIKASWEKENYNSETKLLDFLSTSEVLIIDDFGMEQGDKVWINERFYQIINNRYIDKKITIFTSNEKLEFLKYDDRITNRIKERTFQVPFPEESVRDIIAKKNMCELIAGIRSEVQ